MICSKCSTNNEEGMSACKVCGMPLINSENQIINNSQVVQPNNGNQPPIIESIASLNNYGQAENVTPLINQNITSLEGSLGGPFCSKCGERLLEGMNFCNRCGASRESESMVNPGMINMVNNDVNVEAVKPKNSMGVYIGGIGLLVTFFLSWIIGCIIALFGLGYTLKEKNKTDHKSFVRGLIMNSTSIIMGVGYFILISYLNNL